MEREIKGMVHVEYLRYDSWPEGEPEAWMTFDGEAWHPANPEWTPLVPVEVPEDPGISFRELQDRAQSKGGTIHRSGSWLVEERAYELLAQLANLAPEHLEPYPELPRIRQEAERLVLARMKRYGIADVAEAERVLLREGMPD